MMNFVLGPFRLDTESGLLLRDTEPVALGLRAIALLRALVERPGALVSKDALIEAGWPGQIVEESNLTVQIATLRRVLKAAPGGDRWIETMPRRGYRFTGPVVTAAENGAVAPAPIPVALEPAPRPYADAERRQITAMSCEMIGMSERAHSLSLEDLHEAVGDFRHSVSETVDRHNGFIVRNLGNTALVLFGYPEAHEHDAEQAVRAALELCAMVGTGRPVAGVPMRCRVGIATGNAIIGDLKGGALGDLDIVGDVPNLAAQLRLSAQPNIVTIDPVTRRLIGNLFECRDVGTIDTTGVTEPLRLWQVAGANIGSSRFEALRGSALSSLVGRDEEIDLLLRRWARAKTGDGQIVLVSGEPGIGKSRIVAALTDRIEAEPHLRLRYFCSPHHQDSALFPCIAQLSHAAEFARDDVSDSKLEKLEALLARAAPPPEDMAFIIDLLSLPAFERHPLPDVSPQRKKERTLEALVRQLEGLARQQPVLAVFEDAHWIDPTSRELLDLAIERLRSLPVMLIVTFRPEFKSPWTGQPQVTTLALNRLDRRDRMALVEEIASGKALPDEVVAQLVGRTDGVPLFVEELTKSVLQSGLLREEADRYVLDGALPALAIPTTLHASLMARLDRSQLAKRVAQIGAVVGREFSYALVHAVSDLPDDALRGALASLVASELVFQRGIPPEAFYSFKHALVQDAAYNTLLRRARQQLHAQVADALEAQLPELMDTQPELFAQHYAEAGLIEKSAAFWRKAGERSAARLAAAEAAAQFEKGLEQLALLPDTLEHQRQQLEILSALGLVLFTVKGQQAPETGHAYTRARKLWEQLGSPSEFLHIPFGLSFYHSGRGELELAQRLDEDLLRSGQQRNDPLWLILAHYACGRSQLVTGNPGSSREHFEEVLRLYDPAAHGALYRHSANHLLPLSHLFLGVALLGLGFPDQAMAQGSEGMAEARRLAHPPSLAASMAFNARLHLLAENDAALKEQADELIALSTERGLGYWLALGTLYRGWAEVKCGDVAKGILLLRNGLSAHRATGALLSRAHFVALLAEACELAGQIDESSTLLENAFQLMEQTGERLFEAKLYRQRGQSLLQQGHAEAAEGQYRKALSVAEKQGAKLWELRVAVSLARLWRDQDRPTEARDLLAPIYGWFTEGFGTADLKEAKTLMDELK